MPLARHVRTASQSINKKKAGMRGYSFVTLILSLCPVAETHVCKHAEHEIEENKKADREPVGISVVIGEAQALHYIGCWLTSKHGLHAATEDIAKV